MTKEIMEIMNKAEQKYLATVKVYGMNDRLEVFYSRKLEQAWTDIISKASACVRLGLISQSQVDTLKSKLQARVQATHKKAYEMYVQEFCNGSEHEADVQYWMFHNDLTREKAEELIKWFEEEE
jgi:hypothetical protein